MSIRPNINGYFQSLSDELLSQYQRIRYLIGDRHWLSDGHHKEYLLATLLSRHMPSSVLMSRGFVADPGVPELCSKEQDILIVDKRFQAPLFNQGGLIVALPKTVIASISVKSKMTLKSILETVDNQNSVRNICARMGLKPCRPMCVGYFFEADEDILKDPTVVYRHLQRALREHPPDNECHHSSDTCNLGPDLFCCSSNLIYRVEVRPQTANSNLLGRVLGYNCSGLATAICLTNIIDYIGARLESTEIDIASLVEHKTITQLEPAHTEFIIDTSKGV